MYVTIYTAEEGRQELDRSSYFKIWKTAVFHRVDGPALQFWSEGIEDTKNSWYFIEGKEFGEYGYNKLIKEVKDMPLVLRLVDPRKWVREYDK